VGRVGFYGKKFNEIEKDAKNGEGFILDRMGLQEGMWAIFLIIIIIYIYTLYTPRYYNTP